MIAGLQQEALPVPGRRPDAELVLHARWVPGRGVLWDHEGLPQFAPPVHDRCGDVRRHGCGQSRLSDQAQGLAGCGRDHGCERRAVEESACQGVEASRSCRVAAFRRGVGGQRKGVAQHFQQAVAGIVVQPIDVAKNRGKQVC